MAKAKKRVGKGKAKKGGKMARRKPAAKRKTAAAAASPALRPIVIPGAWPFPMGFKS
jgi:hypothetical protein